MTRTSLHYPHILAVFCLFASILTLQAVESASAQTTPFTSSTPSPSPSTTPTPTPESTPSPLGSGPDVVITYEGELVEFPRYQSDSFYVVEIPEARRSRLIRGDLSACASKNGVTVWSFPHRSGTQAILRHAAGRIEITFAEDLQLFPSESRENTQEKLHSLQKELIERIKNISDQQATDVLEQFAPPGSATLPEPKKRLQVLISDTSDFAKLTKMGEKLPLLPAGPTTGDVHGLQKLLIKGLGNISDQEATNILDQFAPPGSSKAGTPKIRLQVLISNTSDFVMLSKMGEKIPH